MAKFNIPKRNCHKIFDELRFPVPSTKVFIHFLSILVVYELMCSCVFSLTGPTAYAKAHVTDPFSAFMLFSKPVKNIVLNMTNLYGIRKYGENWQMIDLTTLHAYFVLLILAASIYWTKESAHTVVSPK